MNNKAIIIVVSAIGFLLLYQGSKVYLRRVKQEGLNYGASMVYNMVNEDLKEVLGVRYDIEQRKFIILEEEKHEDNKR